MGTSERGRDGPPMPHVQAAEQLPAASTQALRGALPMPRRHDRRRDLRARRRRAHPGQLPRDAGRLVGENELQE